MESCQNDNKEKIEISENMGSIPGTPSPKENELYLNQSTNGMEIKSILSSSENFLTDSFNYDIIDLPDDYNIGILTQIPEGENYTLKEILSESGNLDLTTPIIEATNEDFDKMFPSNLNSDEINIFEVGSNVVIDIPEDMKSENSSEIGNQLLSLKIQNDNVFRLSENRQNDVIKAAKSLFSKRTRTLFHWLFPNISKSALKSNVSDAWETLPKDEKHFYISQVLGKFGLQRSPLMINPQLDGLSKDNPSQSTINNRKKQVQNCLETKKAVHDLLSTYCDLESSPGPSSRKRKSLRIGEREDLEKAKMLKKLREVGKLEVDDDPEFNAELDKYNATSTLEDDSLWPSDISLEL